MEVIAIALRELSRDNEELPLSGHTVVSNNDLLTEILLRLPVMSLVLFKSVCKRWLSLINDAAFIKRRSLIPKIDPPSGLFIKYAYEEVNSGTYGSAPFDIRIPWRLENILKSAPGSCTTILCSRNGLFLCSVMPGHRFCVYNPTLNLFKMLPAPLDYVPEHGDFTCMDFDPTKSPHYKVIHAKRPSHEDHLNIQTYSSETGVWSVVCDCADLFGYFHYGIYMNDAIHWLHTDDSLHYKLDFKNINVTLTKIQLPTAVNCGCELYESRGCLLLIGEDKTHSHQLNVYEMRNGHSEWSMRESLDHPHITFCLVKCISLGEREEDSFMVLGGSRNNVYLYNFVLKTFREFPEYQFMPSKGRGYRKRFLFTPSFASV